MKNNRFIFAVLALMLLCVSLVLASCSGDGEITTEAPGTTDAPEVTSDDVTTETTPDETTAEITEEVTTEVPVETTKEPEVTTEPPHVHSYGAWTNIKEATCTEGGSRERVCSCGEKETEDVAALGHTDGEWIVDKEATADADGSRHQVCAVCGITLKTEIIASKPHTPGEWITDKEATCTEAGSKHQVCSDCGVTLTTESISAKGHTKVTDAAKAASCTESGLTAGSHCSACNEVLEAQEVIPAKGHTEVTDAAVAATCTKDGATEGKHCSVCKAVITARKTVPATGHKDGEWIVDKEATYTEAGSKHLVCATCGATVKTESIPVLEVVKSEYKVTLVDGYGNPVKDVEVSFMSGGKEEEKVKTDASGKATANIASGEYTVEFEAPDAYYVPSETYKVSDAEPAVEIMLVGYASAPQMVYPDEVNGVYSVNVGSVRVPVKNGEMRYFFFAPAEGAVYRFYTDSDKVEVGYYGGSFYISDSNGGTMLDNGVMELEVLHSQVGNMLVIGLKSTSSSVDECTLTVVRYSDMEVQLVELPWEQYVLDHTPAVIAPPKGNQHYVDIVVDISNPLNPSGAVEEIKAVYNENDGYYHLNTADGPVLYAKLAAKTIFQESIYTIVNVTNVGRYFYDENGKFQKKESYNDALIAYCKAADPATGVYPLDHDLVYILQNIGADGWYDMTSPNSIFKDDGVFVYPYNAWFFAVVYFD